MNFAQDNKAIRELLAAFGVQYLDDIPWQVRADWYEEHGYSELADEMREDPHSRMQLLRDDPGEE